MSAAERMNRIRRNRRDLGLREVRLVAPDARLIATRRAVADQVARLRASDEAEALIWIEAIGEFDAPPASP